MDDVDLRCENAAELTMGGVVSRRTGSLITRVDVSDVGLGRLQCGIGARNHCHHGKLEK